MASPKSQYICNACGAATPRWLGKCPACGAWNSLEETAAQAAAGAAGKNRLSSVPQALAGAAEVATLADIRAEDVARTPCGIGELDRVLGGGIVEGGVVLIGGDPGIGKSTLLLQALDALQLQGKTQEAIAAYQKAWQQMDDRLEYRALVGYKLNALGVATTTPQAS